MSTQPWLIEVAIESKSKVDRERLGSALAKLAAEDPTFEVAIDPVSEQTILKGVSELHLDTKLDVLKRTYNIDISVGAPQVAFRERITRPAEAGYTHKRQSDGSGEFAFVKLHIEPNESGKGCQFQTKIAPDAVPSEYISSVEKGIESVLLSGVIAGFPVVDVKVDLTDCKYHDIDSSPQAFVNAARGAFREALQKASSVLLEPVMKVVVESPEDCATSVVSDLQLRRGRIQSQNLRDDNVVIEAMVPLMNMFGYVNSLSLMSQSRATFGMWFDHYAPAYPPEDDPPFRPAIGLRG